MFFFVNDTECRWSTKLKIWVLSHYIKKQTILARFEKKTQNISLFSKKKTTLKHYGLFLFPPASLVRKSNVAHHECGAVLLL